MVDLVLVAVGAAIIGLAIWAGKRTTGPGVTRGGGGSAEAPLGGEKTGPSTTHKR